MAPLKDRTGLVSGKLTVIRLDEEKTVPGNRYWICKCECGKEISISYENLRKNKRKDCGCVIKKKRKEELKVMKGKRFGRLTLIKPTNKRKLRNVVWLAHCDCGTDIEVVGMWVARGNISSCGCLRREIHSRMGKENKLVLRVGKRFGRLRIFEECEERNSRGSVLWNCRCDCGNNVKVDSYRLRKGLVKSCGCLRIETTSLNGRDFALVIYGKKYGMLTAIKPTEDRSWGGVVWECRCDCGGTKYTTVNRLRSGLVKSCGCMKGKKIGKT